MTFNAFVIQGNNPFQKKGSHNLFNFLDYIIIIIKICIN